MTVVTAYLFLQVVEREECLLEKGLDALPDLRERIRINE